MMQIKIIAVFCSGNVWFVAALYFLVCSAYLSPKWIVSCKHVMYKKNIYFSTVNI